jgi:hypothetical protein
MKPFQPRGSNFETFAQIRDQFLTVLNYRYQLSHNGCANRPLDAITRFSSSFRKVTSMRSPWSTGRVVKGGVELAKGGDISSFLSAIISIIQRRGSHDRISHQFRLFFSGVEVEQAVLLFFCPKELFF